MSAHLLCVPCRTLLDAPGSVSAHTGLRPVLDLGSRWLYRCRHCGAFATEPATAAERWSLNLLGQPVLPDKPQ